MAEPLITVALGLTDELQAGLVLRGALSVVLVLGITYRRSWRRNGFRGGMQIWWWRALWPVWAIAVPVLVLSASTRSLTDHLLWATLCFFVGFTEEAIFRGIILRALKGARHAIIWSAVWFGTAHLLGLLDGFDWRMVLLNSVGAFAIGLMLGYVRLGSASIWPGLIAHSFYDYALLIHAGGLRADMEYSPYNALTLGLIATFMLCWASCLLSLEAPTDVKKANGDWLADRLAEPRTLIDAQGSATP